MLCRLALDNEKPDQKLGHTLSPPGPIAPRKRIVIFHLERGLASVVQARSAGKTGWRERTEFVFTLRHLSDATPSFG